MSVSPLQPGELVADRYRIESLLGSGGHAHVYLATQEKLGRKVAIKVLKVKVPTQQHHVIAEQPQQVLIKRFEQEARLISQLRDPHTITMYDYGNTPDGSLYMVCEYVEGESMKELLIREGKLKPERVTHILGQLLTSLQEAHAYGVLHRDLKPDNIMVYTHLGRRDQIKLLDFGIAKIALGEESDNDLTAEGSLVGTPRYIAPERIRGEPLRPASDLYSLGLVAYEALTGKRVLDGLHGVRALQAQLGDPSLRLSDELNISPGLRHIIERMIEKDLEVRYQVAEQVIHDLDRLQRGESIVAEEFDEEATRNDLADMMKVVRASSPDFDQTAKLEAERSTRPGDAQHAPPRSSHAKQTAPALPSHHKGHTAQASVKKQPSPQSQKQEKNQTALMLAVIGGLLIAIVVAIGVLSFLVFGQ